VIVVYYHINGTIEKTGLWKEADRRSDRIGES
jgi:hypothetical protein